jgi:hypothetical protein
MFGDRIDAWGARHRTTVDALRTALAFAALAAGVALHAHESGLAVTLTGAALCGAAAMLFTWLYVHLALAVQRVFFDPWTHVRPEPPSHAAARWAVWTYVGAGLVIFFVIAWLGSATPPVRTLDGVASISVSGGGARISIGGFGMLGLIGGWWIAGRVVLRFLWARARIAAELRTRAARA